MEKDHFKISSQIENIMQDYKKLKSAFTLLEIELKKIDSHNNEIEKSIINLKAEL